MIHSFVTLANICAESTMWQTLSSHERYNINETIMISPLTELIFYEEQVLIDWQI